VIGFLCAQVQETAKDLGGHAPCFLFQYPSLFPSPLARLVFFQYPSEIRESAHRPTKREQNKYLFRVLPDPFVCLGLFRFLSGFLPCLSTMQPFISASLSFLWSLGERSNLQGRRVWLNRHQLVTTEEITTAGHILPREVPQSGRDHSFLHGSLRVQPHSLESIRRGSKRYEIQYGRKIARAGLEHTFASAHNSQHTKVLIGLPPPVGWALTRDRILDCFRSMDHRGLAHG
jgi:hypothetical protein